MLLFVYGTLKYGKSANYLMDGANYICDVRLDDYCLIHKRPAIVPHLGGYVLGQLWEFDDPAILKRLDQYEGYYGPGQGNMYNRVTVTVGDDGMSYPDTFVYVYNSDTSYPLNQLINGAWN